MDETEFNDALTLNLRRGRFLLLIVGDGIREGVEAITEYLQVHAGLHFTLGLIETPIYVMPDGGRVVVPRILARTRMITRTVVSAPDGSIVLDDSTLAEPHTEPTIDHQMIERIRFLDQVVEGLVLDDPDQAKPRVTPKGYCYLYLPAPASSCWIALTYKAGVAGIYATSNVNTLGERALLSVAEQWEEVREMLGGEVELRFVKDRRPIFEEFRTFEPTETSEAIAWMRSRVNDFVNVFRPRVKSVLQDLAGVAA